ncbi:hypothetical protein ABFS83_02G090300 [Erythranthe nasuta]
MANNVFSYFLIISFTLIGFLCYDAFAYHVNGINNVPSDFCMAQQYAPAEKLQGFIDYVCGAYGCGAISPIGPCYLPNNLVDHASFVLDLLYKITGKCNLEIGYRTTINPSYGQCQYP